MILLGVDIKAVIVTTGVLRMSDYCFVFRKHSNKDDAVKNVCQEIVRGNLVELSLSDPGTCIFVFVLCDN